VPIELSKDKSTCNPGRIVNEFDDGNSGFGNTLPRSIQGNAGFQKLTESSGLNSSFFCWQKSGPTSTLEVRAVKNQIHITV